MAHLQYMMLHVVYWRKKDFIMPPGDHTGTQPNQSVSACYGKITPRTCQPDPTPQVLRQQVMYQPKEKKPKKVKAPTTATQGGDQEYHKILQREDSYHTKVKATGGPSPRSGYAPPPPPPPGPLGPLSYQGSMATSHT